MRTKPSNGSSRLLRIAGLGTVVNLDLGDSTCL